MTTSTTGRRAVIIRPGGRVEPALIDGLEDMQKAVGGLIQVLETNHPNLSFFCNEEAWTLEGEDAGVNELANDICSYDFDGRYRILGPVLVMGPVAPNGEKTLGLTLDQANIFLAPTGELLLNELIGRS